MLLAAWHLLGLGSSFLAFGEELTCPFPLQLPCRHVTWPLPIRCTGGSSPSHSWYRSCDTADYSARWMVVATGAFPPHRFDSRVVGVFLQRSLASSLALQLLADLVKSTIPF